MNIVQSFFSASNHSQQCTQLQLSMYELLVNCMPSYEVWLATWLAIMHACTQHYDDDHVSWSKGLVQINTYWELFNTINTIRGTSYSL